ncbi:DUF2867 domain-containing protein [Phytoactinopolyspora mesophila]|uniref:DUF2867 domain-containing protein n=1 Tax=Phytoactinopolyspora mesophila TaxID=2650750 RepID=A0A7K3M5Q8_9ACTN|nr:DUF2867 domain-containing protein [Phytoactinopolyspora mesophila]NDL58659.1 DUF2867 domain-containing protein [Phytoactinopolyspora mesophila]
MKLPETAYTAQPWRIHELAPDFAIEDVWALPPQGDAGELPRLVSAIFGNNFPEGAPLVVRFLWNARWKIGKLFGWDEASHGLGASAPSLRDRLPDELRGISTEPEIDIQPFSTVYYLDDEFAAEMANRTVHTVMHLGWIPDGKGAYHGQMTVLVKPNGRLGSIYLAGIAPLRRFLVYPALLRRIDRQWHKQASS